MDHVVILSSVVFGLLISSFTTLAGGQRVGVNYGLLGSDLPPPAQAVALLKSRDIPSVRIFDPNPAVLNALQGSGIGVVVGTLNSDLPRLASDPNFAAQWVRTHIVPHSGSVAFRYVTAGNEVIPGEFQESVLGAVKNLDAALAAAGVDVPVTTVISAAALGSSFPPSAGEFTSSVLPIMRSLNEYLSSKSRSLFFNTYPFITYTSDPTNIPLDYALFTAAGVVVQDGDFGYTNLFDATLDAMHSAMDKAGGSAVDVAVGETGWASAGAEGATVGNADTYNNNLLAHLRSGAGTPWKRGKAIDAFIFALFNENEKAEGSERNYGIYRPDMTEVYHLNL